MPRTQERVSFWADLCLCLLFLDLCCNFAVACVRGAGCSRVLRGERVVVEKQTVIFASRFVLGVVRFPAQLACALQIIRVKMWWLVGSVLFLCA